MKPTVKSTCLLFNDKINRSFDLTRASVETTYNREFLPFGSLLTSWFLTVLLELTDFNDPSRILSLWLLSSRNRKTAGLLHYREVTRLQQHQCLATWRQRRIQVSEYCLLMSTGLSGTHY